MDRHVAGRRDSEAHLIAADSDHDDLDVIADEDGFVGPA
jgi:hypothetical protein